MTDNDGSGNREQTLEFLVREVAHSREEIEGALTLYGYTITNQGEFTAVDEANGITTEMPQEVVLEALSDYFTNLSEASDNLPAVLPPILPSNVSDPIFPDGGASVSKKDQLGDGWYLPESKPIDEEQHPDYVDALFQKQMAKQNGKNKMSTGKKLLIAGAVLMGLAGTFVLGNYYGVSRTEASSAAEIAQLQDDISGYQTKLSVRKGVETQLRGELASLRESTEKTSTENTALFDMVIGLENQLAGSQDLVDQQIDLDSCNADYTACRTEKEVIEAACNARVAGLEKQISGAVAVVEPAACDCDTLNGQIAALQEDNVGLVGLNDAYDAANTELQAKVVEYGGKFAGLEFDLVERQIALDSCSADYAGCQGEKDSIDATWINREKDLQDKTAQLETLEAQFVINPYQQILTILNGPEEDRSNGLKTLVINYLGNRTVGRKMVVEGNDCNTALGNLYDTIVGEAGDMDEAARVGFVTYALQLCGDLDPNQTQVEFKLEK